MSKAILIESGSETPSVLRQSNSRAARGLTSRPTGVVVRGAIYGGSGYSEETLAVVLGLAERGVPVELQPMHMQTDQLGLLPSPVRDQLEVLKMQRIDPATSVLFRPPSKCRTSCGETSVMGAVRIGGGDSAFGECGAVLKGSPIPAPPRLVGS